jgi:hypothetical protein
LEYLDINLKKFINKIFDSENGLNGENLKKIFYIRIRLLKEKKKIDKKRQKLKGNFFLSKLVNYLVINLFFRFKRKTSYYHKKYKDIKNSSSKS